MKNIRPYEKYDSLLSDLKNAYVAISKTSELQQELKIPSDVTNKLDFIMRTIKNTYADLLKLQETEKILWEGSLAQFSIV